MSQKRPTAGGESCGQDSFVLEEGHAQINRIFVFLYGGRHVDHFVYREYSRACHSDWCLAADRLPAILLWIGMKKSRSRLFRARAVCAAYTSFPRGAHPCGAFLIHRKEFPMNQKRTVTYCSVRHCPCVDTHYSTFPETVKVSAQIPKNIKFWCLYRQSSQMYRAQ